MSPLRRRLHSAHFLTLPGDEGGRGRTEKVSHLIPCEESEVISLCFREWEENTQKPDSRGSETHSQKCPPQKHELISLKI